MRVRLDIINEDDTTENTLEFRVERFPDGRYSFLWWETDKLGLVKKGGEQSKVFIYDDKQARESSIYDLTQCVKNHVLRAAGLPQED